VSDWPNRTRTQAPPGSAVPVPRRGPKSGPELGGTTSPPSSNLTLRQVAGALDLSIGRVRQLIREQRIAATLCPGRHGGRYEITPEEFERFRSSYTRQSHYAQHGGEGGNGVAWKTYRCVRCGADRLGYHLYGWCRHCVCNAPIEEWLEHVVRLRPPKPNNPWKDDDGPASTS
jgi:hypothetical protein